jgi:hypothetical protein
MSGKEPGWDAKAISEIASRHYGGFTAMFERNEWPERGSEMMRKVQTRVKEKFGSIAAFVADHEGKK